MVRVPGVNEGVKSDGVINLVDMYPTLIELCGLSPNPNNDGRSFAKLLENPQMSWNEPTLSTMGYMNHALTDGRYRYISYKKGVQELYDHNSDPLEHNNLANNPEYAQIIAKFKKYLPTHNEPESPRNTLEKKKSKASKKINRRLTYTQRRSITSAFFYYLNETSQHFQKIVKLVSFYV